MLLLPTCLPAQHPPVSAHIEPYTRAEAPDTATHACPCPYSQRHRNSTRSRPQKGQSLLHHLGSLALQRTHTHSPVSSCNPPSTAARPFALIRCNPCPHAPSYPQKGQTLLHWAASGGHLDLARALLAAGAPKDAVNGQGHTPLWAAGVHGRVALVAELAGAGCDKEAKEGKVRGVDKGGVWGVLWVGWYDSPAHLTSALFAT